MEKKSTDTIVNQEEIKLYEGNEYVQLQDIFNLMENRINALQKKVDQNENSGELRIAISNYYQAKKKFEVIYSLCQEEKHPIDPEVIQQIEVLKEKYSAKVMEFQTTWSSEMRHIMAEQEDPSIVLDRKESRITLIKELRETALAMNKHNQSTNSHQPLLNIDADTRSPTPNNILAQVSLDNRGDKGKSIISINSSQNGKRCCACRCCRVL